MRRTHITPSITYKECAHVQAVPCHITLSVIGRDAEGHEVVLQRDGLITGNGLLRFCPDCGAMKMWGTWMPMEERESVGRRTPIDATRRYRLWRMGYRPAVDR